MKKLSHFALAFCIASCMLLFPKQFIQAQDNSVAIGSTTVKSNAVLWLNGNGSQGLLLPSVSNTSNVSGPDAGMVVYQTADNRVYYFDGSAWVGVGGGSGGGGDAYTLRLQGTNLELLSNGSVQDQIALTSFTVGGDISGNIQNASVVSLNGIALPNGTPGTNQILIYNGTSWSYQDIPTGTFTGVVTDGTLTGDGTAGAPLSVANVDDADADPSNEIQNLSLSGTVINIDGGVGVDLAPIVPPGGTDDQNLLLTGDVLSIEGGTGSVDLSNYIDDADADPANEIQTLGLNGNIIDISGGNSIDLTPILGGGSGDITEVIAGTGLSGGGTTGSVTLNLDPLTVADITDAGTLAGLNTVDGTTISDLSITDADISNTAGINVQKLDFSGTSDGQTLQIVGGVPAWSAAGGSNDAQSLQGTPIASPLTPTSGQVLKWNGAQWVAGLDDTGAGGAPTLNPGEIIVGDGASNAAVGVTGDLTMTNGDFQIAADAVTTTEIGTAGITDANRVLTTDASGNPQWELKTAVTSLPQDLDFTGNIITLTGDPTPTSIDLSAYDTDGSDDVLLTTPATNNISGSFASGFTIANDVINSGNIIDGGIISDDIQDGTISTVDIASTGNEQVLTTDAAGVVVWEPKSIFAGGVTDLSGLSDAAVTAPADAQILVYDAATDNQFENVSISGDITLNNAGQTTIANTAGDNIISAINNAATTQTIDETNLQPGAEKGILVTDGASVNWLTEANPNRVFGTDLSNNLVARSVVLSTAASVDNSGVRAAGTATDAVLVSEAAVREAIDAAAGGTLQSAYDGGSEIVLDGANDFEVKLSDASDFFTLDQTTSTLVFEGDIDIPLTGEIRTQGVRILSSANLVTSVGRGAGTNGTDNVFVGTQSGQGSIVDGGNIRNTFVGHSSGNSFTTGNRNTFIGTHAGSSSDNTGSNTFVGSDAGFDNTSGSLNTFIGTSTGSTNLTGSSNILIGAGADVSADGLINAIAIGNGATATTDNSFRLGTNNNVIFGGALMPGNVAGTAGQFLQSNGPGAVPTWVAAPGGGSLQGAYDGGSNITMASAQNIAIETSSAIPILTLNEASGNVGIGTGTPLYPLSVRGRAYVYGDGSIGSGEVSPGTIDFAIDDNDTGFDVPGDGDLALIADNQEQIRIQPGFVGIGTTTPQAQLDIEGNLRYADGTEAAGRVLTSDLNGFATWQDLPVGSAAWGLAGNTGTDPVNDFFGTTDATDVVIRTDNIERLRVNSVGRVGINTSTTGLGFESLLEIQSYGSGGRGNLILRGAQVNPTDAVDIVWRNYDYSEQARIWTDPGSGDKLYMGTQGTTPNIAIDNVGNVGIGISAPTSDFEIEIPSAEEPANSGTVATGNLRLSSVGSPLALDMGIADDAYSAAWLQAHAENNQSSNNNLLLNPNGGNIGIGNTNPQELLVVGDDLGNIYATYNAAVIGNASTGGALVLGNSTDVMRLDHGTSGSRIIAPGDLFLDVANVGIGTSAPTRRLTVNSNVNSSTDPQIQISDQSGTGDAAATFISQAGNTYTLGLDASDSDKFKISDNNTLGANDRFVLDVAGNIGIGTNSPTEEFEVGGGSSNTIRVESIQPGTFFGALGFSSLELSAQQGASAAIEWRMSVAQGGLTPAGQQPVGNDLLISNTSGPEYVFTATSFNPYGDNVNALGASSYRWTSLWATDGTINTSDRRLKSNISELKYGLSALLKLNPVSFNWNDKLDEERKLGLIAQEVEQYIPEVIENKSGEGYLGLSYSELIPVTIKAIQEQQEIIENQKVEIAQLKEKLSKKDSENNDRFEELEAKIEHLTQMISSESVQSNGSIRTEK